jgi:hypothetical protein
MRYPIDDITVDPIYQHRVEALDVEHLIGIARAIEANPNHLDQYPIDLAKFADSDSLFVINGHHRFKAACELGLAEISAIVHYMTRSQAIEFVAGANDHAGSPLKRTRADRQKSIRAILDDPELRCKQDSDIAKIVGVDPKTVGNIRKSNPAWAAEVRIKPDGSIVKSTRIRGDQAATSKSMEIPKIEPELVATVLPVQSMEIPKIEPEQVATVLPVQSVEIPKIGVGRTEPASVTKSMEIPKIAETVKPEGHTDRELFEAALSAAKQLRFHADVLQAQIHRFTELAKARCPEVFVGQESLYMHPAEILERILDHKYKSAPEAQEAAPVGQRQSCVGTPGKQTPGKQTPENHQPDAEMLELSYQHGLSGGDRTRLFHRGTDPGKRWNVIKELPPHKGVPAMSNLGKQLSKPYAEAFSRGESEYKAAAGGTPDQD